MLTRLPCFENYAAALKIAGAASLLAHGLLLGALAWTFPHSLAEIKDDGVVIDLAYVVSSPPRENVAEDTNPPGARPHSPSLSEATSKSESRSEPVAKSGPLPAKKPRKERPTAPALKTLAHAKPPNPPAADPAKPKLFPPSAPVREPANPRPAYPELARKRGQEGIARVRCQISPAGLVTDASLAQSSGHKLLDDAALKTVRKWRFKPALSNGQPVSGSVIVPVEFRLQ